MKIVNEEKAVPAKPAEILRRRKAKRWTAVIAAVVCVCVCIYCFPVYRVLQAYQPDYYTAEELSKLLYTGSGADRETARTFVAMADEALSDISTPGAELGEKYGLLSRYATAAERGGARETHDLRLWSARFDENDGYVWVCYSNAVYDAAGELVCGSWDVPALWIFEKDGTGNWQLIRIREHP